MARVERIGMEPIIRQSKIGIRNSENVSVPIRIIRRSQLVNRHSPLFTFLFTPRIVHVCVDSYLYVCLRVRRVSVGKEMSAKTMRPSVESSLQAFHPEATTK